MPLTRRQGGMLRVIISSQLMYKALDVASRRAMGRVLENSKYISKCLKSERKKLDDKCLKSELVWILDTSSSSRFQIVQISDTWN